MQNITSITNKVLAIIKERKEAISFNPSDHSYYSHGQRVFSVTQIMQQLATYKFKDIPMEVLMNKARIGTMTHELGEMLFTKREITVAQYLSKVDPYNLWGDQYRDEVLGYWTAMVRYWKEKNPPFFASEFKVFDSIDKIAGTIDNIGYDLATNTWFISDYKTSAKIDTFMQPLQLFAYANTLNHILGVELFTKGLLIQLKKDGTYQEYWFNLNDYRDRWYLLLENFQVNILPLLETK